MKYIFTFFIALAFSTVTMAQADKWLTISLDSSATIDFPTQPQAMPAMGQTMYTEKYINHVYTALVSPTAYRNDGTDSVAIQNTYKLYLSGILGSLKGTRLVDEKDFSYRSYPGKEYLLTGEINSTSVWVTARILILDGEQYAYVFTTLDNAEQQSPDKDRFFNSLNIGGHATANALPAANPLTPKLDIQQYLPQLEIFGAIVGGVFVFILLAVGVQSLLKRKKV
jgi:hypothetical protein